MIQRRTLTDEEKKVHRNQQFLYLFRGKWQKINDICDQRDKKHVTHSMVKSRINIYFNGSKNEELKDLEDMITRPFIRKGNKSKRVVDEPFALNHFEKCYRLFNLDWCREQRRLGKALL